MFKFELASNRPSLLPAMFPEFSKALVIYFHRHTIPFWSSDFRLGLVDDVECIKDHEIYPEAN